ncbi:uncharacterized protein LOC114745480 [Neltuma alba]|uniref:uncharacterized protein LOC114745480 n=1 Tax=Neltuma alba TaxID=207710 RepID=UPI0010A2E039|nr:uncharacterized protein LOC114745480 [Prosopis alba]
MLQELDISECEELVYIVEEDYETNDDDHHLCHEPCFPCLEQVSVNDCDKLRHLFSITISGILPKLSSLKISRANGLEHVLVRQGEMKEMVMKDVLPQLSQLELIDLPNLTSLCHGIDFQALKGDDNMKVDGCPKFSFYEISTTQLQVGPETAYSQVEKKVEETLPSHLCTKQSLNTGEATQQPLMEKVPLRTSPNLPVLPTRDNTHASAKSFEEKEEEGKGSDDRNDIQTTNQQTPNVLDDVQLSDKSLGHAIVSSGSGNLRVDPGGLMTTQGHQSDIRTKSSFLKENPKTSIHGDPFVPCTATISSKQTSKAILPPSPKSSKASLCKSTDGDIQVSDKSHATVIGNAVPIPQPTTLYKDVSGKEINETNVIQDESKENMASHDGRPDSIEHVTADPSNLRQMEQEPSCSRGQMEHPDVTKSSDINTKHAQSSLLPFSTPSKLAPSVTETDRALNVGGVQEIVEMMKLEGSEASLLAEALMTHPQLRLSPNDRSTQMLCISYRVLIDILHILTTRTPFTITEADKRLLEEKLKDACFVGFDKDWLESIKTKVFNTDVTEVDGIQEILKGLDSDLKTNEALLAATRDQEVEAARVVELAQKDLDAALQEHANVMANHTKLLKARQDILARQNQCWEMIASKNKHFGF